MVGSESMRCQAHRQIVRLSSFELQLVALLWRTKPASATPVRLLLASKPRTGRRSRAMGGRGLGPGRGGRGYRPPRRISRARERAALSPLRGRQSGAQDPELQAADVPQLGGRECRHECRQGCGQERRRGCRQESARRRRSSS
jgi:hypothetical protein